MARILFFNILIALCLYIAVGQDESGITKENLGPNVNSAWDERAPVISPDGRTLFFTRGYHPDNTGAFRQEVEQDIWFSEMDENGNWGPAKNIGKPLNNIYPNSLCSVTPDGNTILLLGGYNEEGYPEQGYSISHRTESGWSFPQKLEIQNYYNYSRYSIAYLTNDGKKMLLAIDRSDSYGMKDLYISYWQGGARWSEPENLGPAVNSTLDEYSPFLASDGKTLYFSSKGHGARGGYDVYVSRRLDSTWKNWSEPENLGEEINSRRDDLFFKISSRADYIYFLSYEDSYGMGDIFRIKLPEKLRPEPVALITGKVYFANTLDPVNAKITYETMPGYEEAGIARTNPKTGEYKITLPIGKKYRYYASASDFISSGGIIDLADINDFREIERDINLSLIEAGKVMSLEPVYFKKGQSDVQDEHIYYLGQAVNYLNGNPESKLKIISFSVPGESPEVNRMRAENIAGFIISKYIPKNRVTYELRELPSGGSPVARFEMIE